MTLPDALVKRLVQAADGIQIGHGLDEGVFLGPVIRKEHKERAINYIETGEKEGAILIRDGRSDCNLDSKGYFVGATVFDHVKPGMKIWQDEIFAPVLSIVRVESFYEAISITNESEFANSACVFTDSASTIRQFREEIDAGMLGVNIGVPTPMSFFPFSGWKKSFYGDLHVNGHDGVEFYTRRKVVTGRF